MSPAQSNARTCPKCHGEGMCHRGREFAAPLDTPPLRAWEPMICPACDGKGKVDES